MESYLALSGTTRNCNNLLGQFFLLHANGFFDGNFIERIHRMFDSLCNNATFVGLDTNLLITIKCILLKTCYRLKRIKGSIYLDGIINYAFATDQNAQGHLPNC